MNATHVSIITRYQVNRHLHLQREGQAWFNAVHAVLPEFADKFRAGPHDPFHNDEHVDAFLAALEAHLGMPNPPVIKVGLDTDCPCGAKACVGGCVQRCVEDTRIFDGGW